MKPTIEIKSLSKRYNINPAAVNYLALRDVLADFIKQTLTRRKLSVRSEKGSFWALKNVSFSVGVGEVLGIIGPNGAGKSTLLKILTRITPPTAGEVILRGRVASLLEVGTGFHPELTGRENVYLNGAILGMGRAEVKKKFDDIVDFAGVEKFIDMTVKHYSSGMQVRLAFSVAAHLESDILLVDEVLAVGDAEFQKKSLGRMESIRKEGRTVLFVSHNLSAISALCGRVIFLDRGKIVDIGNPQKIIAKYLKSATVIKPEVKLAGKSKYANSFAKLLSVSVIDRNGKTKSSFDITKAIGIEIKYEITQANIWFDCVILVKDSSNIILFQSQENPNRNQNNIPKSTGIYKSVCWIPGNLLAEGIFAVRVLFDNYARKQDIIDFNNVVTFHVLDELRGNSIHGKTIVNLKGVIRPKLKWEREKLTGV